MNVETLVDMHAWMMWNAMGWVVVSLPVIDRDSCRCMVSYVNGVWIIRGAMQCLDGLNGCSRIGCENSDELKNAGVPPGFGKWCFAGCGKWIDVALRNA